MSLSRNTPLRPRSYCRKCGKTLCSCGEPPKMKRSRPNPVNSPRKAKRYARDFGDWADEVRAMACHWCGKPGPSDPAHAKSRGSGGDKRDLLPMCRKDHRAYDEYRLGVDHEQAIADARELYDSHHKGEE